MSARRVIEKGRLLAAEMLEATVHDVAYADGAFTITGTDRGVSLFDVAAFAERRGEHLAADADFDQQRESYSSGCHVCEVEIDPQTGRTALLAHVLVTDVGRAVNPMLVDGQVHGAAAQGLGQAAMEAIAYDPQTGQTLTGSLMDYCLPRADDLPFFSTATAETRETDNPLGVRGVGEGPTTGSPAAYMNALADALAQAGAAAVQMPATPLKVWRALRCAQG
jgi:carbon-monoxide dehydrogenase large subunit